MLIMLQGFLETAIGIGLMAGPALGGVIYGVSSCNSCLKWQTYLHNNFPNIIHTENTESSKVLLLTTFG